MTQAASSPPPAPPAAAPQGPVDVTPANFVAEVMTPSVGQIVVVDFWAPWCGPCKQLAPVLEQAVAATNGAAKLVKINIDTCPQIAQQLRVQSIPAVFAFFNKQIVDGFMGAIPASEIKAWLDELIKATGAKPQTAKEDFTAALKQANDLLESGNATTARAIFADVLSEEPENIDAFAGVLRAMIALGQQDEATGMLAQAPAALADHKALAAIRTTLELAAQAQETAGDVASLETKLKDNEEDHQTRFDLALALYGAGQTEKALAQLLELVRRNRTWNDEAARKQLVKILETLGFDHPLAMDTRKQLSTILFS